MRCFPAHPRLRARAYTRRERLTPDSPQCNQRPCYLCPSPWGPPAPPDHGEGEEPRAHGAPTEPEVSMGWPRWVGGHRGGGTDLSCPPLPTVPRPCSCLQCPTALPREGRCPQAPSESPARATGGGGGRWARGSSLLSRSWFPGSCLVPVMAAKPVRRSCPGGVRVGPVMACCPIIPSRLHPHPMFSPLDSQEAGARETGPTHPHLH